MLSGVARKLYKSVKRGDPWDPDWFEDALAVAMSRKRGLDEVIWEAVREIIDQSERQKKRVA